MIDGPFTESKELIAGFWLIQAKDMEEAIEWMKRAHFGGDVALETRPVFETEDLPIAPGLKVREERLRAETAANSGRPK